MRIFEAVARHNSISRAANELHLSQPAVSMQMKQLERLLGLPLIEQIGKKLFLTEAGNELREHAQRLVARMHELKTAMDRFRGLECGAVRLEVISTVNHFLLPMIANLLARHPGMRISVQVANRQGALAALADNRADIAITGRPRDTTNLVALPLLECPLVVIASPTHRLARRVGIPLLELARENFLIRERGAGLRDDVDQLFAELGVGYLQGGEFNTNEAIKQAVEAGLGISLVARQTIDIELETRRLVVLAVEGFPIMGRWYILHRCDKRLSAAATAVVDLLLSSAGLTGPSPKRARGAHRKH
jgi:DNA-binding transcriptional LysR family regulator